MSHTTHSSGILFSAASLDAALVAKLTKDLMLETIYSQENKKSALEAQALATQTVCDASVDIGEAQKEASIKDGWSSISMGIGTGGGELLGGAAGLLIYKGSLKEVNGKITNNENCRDILLGKPKVNDQNEVELEVMPGKASDEQLNLIKQKINNWNPDSNLSEYEGSTGIGEDAFRADVKIVRTLGNKEDLEIPKQNAKASLKQNRELQKSYSGSRENWKNMIRTLGQSSGQCASGLQTQEKGEAQAAQAQKECIKAMGDFVNTSGRGSADASTRSSEQKAETAKEIAATLKALIGANLQA